MVSVLPQLTGIRRYQRELARLHYQKNIFRWRLNVRNVTQRRTTKQKCITLSVIAIIFARPEPEHILPYHNRAPAHFYVGHLESKERLRIQPAQLFNFS